MYRRMLRREHRGEEEREDIPAGRAALLSIISAARSVLRMLVF